MSDWLEVAGSKNWPPFFCQQRYRALHHFPLRLFIRGRRRGSSPPAPPPCKFLRPPPRPLRLRAARQLPPRGQARGILSMDLDSWEGGREGSDLYCISRTVFRPPLASALLQTRHMPGPAGRLRVNRYVQPAKRLSHAALVPHALRADGEGGSGRFRTESYSSPSRMCRFRLALPCLPTLPSPLFASSSPSINAPHLQNPSAQRVWTSCRLQATCCAYPGSACIPVAYGTLMAREANRRWRTEGRPFLRQLSFLGFLFSRGPCPCITGILPVLALSGDSPHHSAASAMQLGQRHPGASLPSRRVQILIAWPDHDVSPF